MKSIFASGFIYVFSLYYLLEEITMQENTLHKRR